MTAFDHGLVIPWPWTPDDDEPEAELAPGRRRRSTRLERWTPTILFAGGILGIVLVLFLTRAILIALQPAPTSAAPPILPAPEIIEAPLPPAEPQSAPAAPPIRFSLKVIEPTYTVVPGDTLSSIAQRHNTTVAALRGLNNLPEDAFLRVGQRLVIP